jgi:hypothetical protein
VTLEAQGDRINAAHAQHIEENAKLFTGDVVAVPRE